jgi:hypothetical protein
MKNGARFGATSQPDPTDVTHGRFMDSDLARCLNRREMALWAVEKKRQFTPFLSDGTPKDLGTAKEFIDQYSGRLDWNVGQPSGCPAEGEADQFLSSAIFTTWRHGL